MKFHMLNCWCAGYCIVSNVQWKLKTAIKCVPKVFSHMPILGNATMAKFWYVICQWYWFNSGAKWLIYCKFRSILCACARVTQRRRSAVGYKSHKQSNQSTVHSSLNGCTFPVSHHTNINIQCTKPTAYHCISLQTIPIFNEHLIFESWNTCSELCPASSQADTHRMTEQLAQCSCC
jgi:hypothetical protein